MENARRKCGARGEREIGVPRPSKRTWWWAAMVLAVGLLVLGARVAMALNVAGIIDVSATMGQLSPNPIRVGDTATASLSASYSQPGNVPEGTYPTPQYSWSVSVQYKPLYADSYGAPPSNSYTLTISPSQPSSTGGAQVSFTPLIAGYWQLTGICDVTLTDQAGNDYWTGSGISSPVEAASYLLHIEYGGMNADGQSQPVCAGQQIPVVADYGPADMVVSWTVPGQILADYAPAPGKSWSQSAVATPVPPGDFSNPDIACYWVYVGAAGQYNGEKVVLKGFLSGATATRNTTFYVYQPGGKIEGSYTGTTSADDNYLADLQGGIWSSDTWLHLGGTFNPNRDVMGAYTPGVEFNASWQLPPKVFGNDYFAIQTISSFTIWLHTATADKGSQSPTNGTILDTSYPYGWASPPAETTANTTLTTASANDSPGINVSSASEATYDLDFDMHLMFQPAGTDSIPVPVSGVTWSWAASALLTQLSHFGGKNRIIVQPRAKVSTTNHAWIFSSGVSQYPSKAANSLA